MKRLVGAGMAVTEALVGLEVEKLVGVGVGVASLDRGLRWIERP